MPEKTKAPVLITGCSSGIGRATAERLAKSGWPVYATARRLDAIADLEQAGCKLLALDVCDEESMQLAVRTVEQDHGAVGILINNAGYSQSGAVEDVPIELVRQQFETNVFGAVRLIQLVLPAMRNQGSGKIINLSSMGAKFTFPGGGYYHATKYALESVSDALRFELRGFGIDVVLIEPGIIKTNFGEAAVKAIGTSADSPYAHFNAAIGQATEEAYEKGMISLLGGKSEAVARKIEKVLNRRHPRARYMVTPSAYVLVGLRRLLPDRAWDASMRRQFPTPGA